MTEQSGLPEIYIDSAGTPQIEPLKAFDQLVRNDPALAAATLEALYTGGDTADFDERQRVIAQAVGVVLAETDHGRWLTGLFDDATVDTIEGDPRFGPLAQQRRIARGIKHNDLEINEIDDELTLLGLAVYARRVRDHMRPPEPISEAA
jgi:hypothetical protein